MFEIIFLCANIIGLLMSLCSLPPFVYQEVISVIPCAPDKIVMLQQHSLAPKVSEVTTVPALGDEEQGDNKAK